MGEPIDPNPQPTYRPRPGPPPASYPPPPASYSPPPASYSPPPTPYPPQGHPYGFPGYSVPPPPGAPPARSRARRNAIIAAAVVVVVGAGAGLGWYFTSSGGSSSSHRVKVPAAFDGYTQLTTSAAHQLEATMRSFGDTAGAGAAKRIFDAASIAVYAKDSGDQPVLVALVVPTASTADGASADEISSGLLQGAISQSSVYPSGPHGGVTRCGSTQFGIAAETMCSWSDSRTSGVVVSVNPPVPPTGLAGVSRSFRDQVE